jgi:hypothetical protein
MSAQPGRRLSGRDVAVRDPFDDESAMLGKVVAVTNSSSGLISLVTWVGSRVHSGLFGA